MRILKETILWLIIIQSLGLLLVTCTQTETNKTLGSKVINAAIIQHITTDSISINWDDPNSTADSVAFYQLYYHTENSATWKQLKDSIKTTTVTVRRNQLSAADSIFYFGTCAVTMNGKKSIINGSSDSTASPTNWAIHWN